jgi:transcription termination factor Rho
MRRGSRRRHRRNRQEWSPQGNPQGNSGQQGNPPQGGSRGPVRDPRQVQVPTEGETFPFIGIAEVTENIGGFVRQANQNYLPSREDVVIPPSVMRDYALRDGTQVEGLCREASGVKVVVEIQKASGLEVAQYRLLPHFADLTSISPEKAFRLADEPGAELTLRVLDLVAPIGKGQRGLIVSPPKAGKTTILEHIGLAIVKSHPEAHLMLMLVDERPEEVTHFKRVLGHAAEILASTSDSASDAHIRLARLCLERAKRMVETKKDVVILLDSLTRLGRASNRETGPGGRTMSGGVDSRALQFPRQFFGAARTCEGNGSLTIIATALIETGSRMDEVIFQEFKGTGNMEIILDRQIAERRIFPAVDVLKSGTRREELLMTPDELRQRHTLRRALAEMSSIEAAQFLTDRLSKTQTNRGFLETLVPPPTTARRLLR